MSKQDEKFVAVALLTRDDVRSLGDTLKKVYTIEQSPEFLDLLRALDKVDQSPLTRLADRPTIHKRPD